MGKECRADDSGGERIQFWRCTTEPDVSSLSSSVEVTSAAACKWVINQASALLLMMSSEAAARGRP